MEFDKLPVLAFALVMGCSSSTTTTSSSLSIVSASGDAPTAVAGDAIPLKIVDASGAELPSGVTITWSGVPTITALDPNSTAASPLPTAGTSPTAVFVKNPGRPDRTDLANVLFVLDAGSKSGGSLELTATLSGSMTGTVTRSIPVTALAAGDATKGAATYGASGANCAACHGAKAAGSPANADGSYTIEGQTYSYPAPGLDAETNNLGSDPGWNAALLAFASRADVDNGGLTLRLPMPDWTVDESLATHATLTTSDYADIYAWLKTQGM